MLESSVERTFMRMVRKLGGKAYKLYHQKDEPDRIVVLPYGAHLLVELKQRGKAPRAGQLRAHARLRRMGHCVIVADGSNWPAIFTLMHQRVTVAKAARSARLITGAKDAAIHTGIDGARSGARTVRSPRNQSAR